MQRNMNLNLWDLNYPSDNPSNIVLKNNNLNNQVDIVFQNISYTVQVTDEQSKSLIPFATSKKQKIILKGISGICKAGEVTVIMGSSGAGKTTLLNVLACRIDPSKEGKIYANNLQYTYDMFGDFANYVMQTDVLMQTLTVRETLQFAAKLKLNLPIKQIKNRVTKLVDQLKLQKCLDTLVGGIVIRGISGGQRKRTSIAFQLMSQPKVIFLDQPTSGLDSLTSYIIVSYLKKLAKKDKITVIMTVHQPNQQLYRLFDRLILLVQGNVIYQDKAYKIKEYFQKNFSLICPQFTNLSDYFMSKVHFEKQQNREMYQQYFDCYQRIQKQQVKNLMVQKQAGKVSFRKSNITFSNTLQVLLHRNFKNFIRNPLLLKFKIIQVLIIAPYAGGIYFGIGDKNYLDKNVWFSITGFMYTITIGALISTLSPVSLSFPLQRNVFIKQQNSKMYTVTQYYLARNMVELPELMVYPLVYVSIYYFMAGLAGTTSQFFFHVLVNFLVAFYGSSLGLVVGSMMTDTKALPLAVTLVLLPIATFSGFFKNRNDLPAWNNWIQNLSPNKYGFIALVDNQVQNRPSYVQKLHFDVSSWNAVLILACLGIFLRIMSLFTLWISKKIKR